MVELLHTTINGHVMDHGRTHLRPDGGYESYDLVGAKRGSRLRIDTIDPVTQTGDTTSYYLTKKEAPENAAASVGWELRHQKRRMGMRKKVGEGAVTVFSRMKGGGPVRTPSVVLRRGHELGIPDPNVPHIVMNMGAIASMAHVKERWMIQEKIKEMLGRITMRR